MTDLELQELLLDLESDRVERKQSASDTTKVCEAICAFANDMPNHRQPGVLFFGVTDDGQCVGLPITDELLLNLAGFRSDGNTLPIPSMDVQKRTVNGCDLAVVIVHPSSYPPVRYRGRVCIRVGPRRAIASLDEERRLNEKRRSADLPFDLREVAGATTADLDLDFFVRSYLPSAIASDILRLNERTIEQRLASVRFTTAEHPNVPTVAGVLSIGKSPADYIPGAYVQFLRIDGAELSDPIADQKECHGPITDQLIQLDDILRANVHIRTDIKSDALEKQNPDFPLVALQQYVRNAVMHRNYETSNAPIRVTWFRDRVEIQNPGGPYGQVTRLNFGAPGITDYRNPNLAESMRVLGFVQRFGVGLQVARRALRDNDNPEPEFDVQDNHILVTVRARAPE